MVLCLFKFHLGTPSVATILGEWGRDEGALMVCTAFCGFGLGRAMLGLGMDDGGLLHEEEDERSVVDLVDKMKVVRNCFGELSSFFGETGLLRHCCFILSAFDGDDAVPILSKNFVGNEPPTAAGDGGWY